jgi:SAM-dependent methyltransferase
MTTVNYSLDILQSEDADRQHILAELRRLQQVHGIVGRRVLELGCGNGRNLRVFQGENEVLGIDGLDEAVAHASRLGIQAQTADLNQPLDMPDQSVDCVLLLDVLEHLEWPERCLRQAHRVLKPDGLLFVNVPNHFTMTARLRILRGRGGVTAVGYFPQSHDWNYPHIRFFSHDSIQELVRHCGFAVVSDRSHAFPAVPMSHELRRLGAARLIDLAAKRWPNAYAGGFFLVARRP